MKRFTQEQNEAFIRLMLAARYEDLKLSLPESDEIEKQVEGLEWESNTPPDMFVKRATAEVRKALETEETKAEMIKAQCEAFEDSASKAWVMEKIRAVLAADGLDPKENELLKKIRESLKV